MTVQYKGTDVPVQISSITNTLNYIQEHILPDIFEDDPTITEKLIYSKISKNSNIEKTVTALCNKEIDDKFICLFSYGSNIQKMLSIVEIFKKVKTEKDLKQMRQWNKMISLKNIEEGRNELLEKKTIVPILITLITTSESLTSPIFQNDKNMFTQQ
ncbi:hypothetical protein C6P45_001416 [Maudiozyma exigua]|uniref:DNA/RNA-binding protein Alba-like domain-containing protein n=1 Tax=Maudiozyma exigua TaxID=34358 RepID=A0A9P7B6L4_MAUEX|nr:hypothetical protein C6P45_001416 [Kazachstania exigua]